MPDDPERDAATNGGSASGGNGDGGTGESDSETGGEGGGTGGNGDGADGHVDGTDGGNGGGGRDDSDVRNGGEDEGSGDDGPTRIQTTVVIISVGFAVALFAYGGWQIVESPSADVPSASVVDTGPMPDGRVAVTVGLRNPTGVGLVSATVEANCSDPPPSAGLSYVPASSTRTATLVCPPGTTAPDVEVVDWVSR